MSARGPRPAGQGALRMRAGVLGLLLIMMGCGNGLNGHDPVEAFQPLSFEEKQAIAIMRAYIGASEALMHARTARRPISIRAATCS